MKYYEFELDGETIKLRLTSSDVIALEKKTGMSIMDYVQDFSLTTVITLLMYMRRSSVPNFSEKDAGELYDKLVDNDYTLADIINKIIMEALVVSGFMSKDALKSMSNK